MDHQINLTWVKEDESFQTSVLRFVNLDVLHGLHNLVQDPAGDVSHVRVEVLPGDDGVVAEEKQISQRNRTLGHS